MRRMANMVAVLVACAGCTPPSSTAKPERPPVEIEAMLPFQHPAAEGMRLKFLKLDVRSEADYRSLPRRDRYLWDVKWFETEVMNGGIDQYFGNSAGDHAAECLEALSAIGAEDSARLLRQAISQFPDHRPSPNREIRIRQMRKITGEKYLDDFTTGEIEADLYQRLSVFYDDTDPAAQ